MDPERFLQLKMWLLEIFNVSRDALHIHVGIAIFLGVWLIFRRPWAGILAWMIVLGFAVYGEVLDHANESPKQYHVTEPEHRRDVINTMAWPTLLLFLGWFIFARLESAKKEESSGDLPDETINDAGKEPPPV